MMVTGTKKKQCTKESSTILYIVLNVKTIIEVQKYFRGTARVHKKPRNTTVKQNISPKNMKSMREYGSCKVTDQMCTCK
jgi:hypothetical protein